MKKILFKLLNILSALLVKTRIHRLFPGLVSVYDFFGRLFWPYKNIVEVQGSKMCLDVDEKDVSLRRTFQFYASNKIHEQATTNLFKEVVKKGNVVIDLGANIGYFTLLSARLAGPQGRVYSFEPETKNFKYLSKNIEINGYKQVTPVQRAVSDKNGKTRLYLCNYESGHHTINQHEGIEAYRPDLRDKKEFIEIETVTLDSFLEGKEKKIDVIKMDVEGAECLALSGMDKILKENKDLKMFVEFFPLLIRKMGSSPREFIRKILEEYCFSVFVVPDDYNAGKKETIEIKTVQKLMDLCKGEKDHVNLFLKR